MKQESKIALSNVFGKAAAITGTGAGLVVYYELARLLIAATDTSGEAFNPAGHVAPGLLALGVSLGAGLGGMYLGHLKRRLVDEFNYQVKLELQAQGLELVEDDAQASSSFRRSSKASRDEGPRYRRIRNDNYRVPPPSNDRFWEGLWIGSWMSSSSSSGSSGRSRSRSSSSSSSSNNGQGVAIAIGIVIMAAAAAASAYVSYKALRANFGKSPDLLTKPDGDFFSEEELPQLEAGGTISMPPVPEPSKARM